VLRRVELLAPAPDSTLGACRGLPAEVRSRIMARSNSAKAPTICIIMRPAGVVVSIASVIRRALLADPRTG
jgi:hypothetical protein